MFDKFDKGIKIISKGAPKHMTREHAGRMPSTRLGAAVMPSRVWCPGGESVSWDLFLIDLCLSCMVCFSIGAIQVCVARCEPFVQMQLSRKIRCVAKLTTVARVRAVSRKVGNVANMREVFSRADRLVSPSMVCVLFPSLKMWNSDKKEKVQSQEEHKCRLAADH